MENWRGRLKFVGIFSLVYVGLFYGIVGWRVDHLLFLLLVTGLCLIHRYGYYAVLGFTGVIAWTILYDVISVFPNYQYNTLHIQDLYDLEVSLFGVYENGLKVTLCEWFGARQNTFMSLFCGLSYLMWIPAPMVFCLYLVYKNKPNAVAFAYGYLFTNLIGITIYYLFPAAPPWYYLEYGDVMDTTVMGSEALLSEFDRLTGTSIFHGIYTKGSNVFGAVPSLHSAYPLLSLLFAFRFGYKRFAIFFAIMGIGTWVGAVYTQHHYLIDVLLGLICAYVAYRLLLLFAKTKLYRMLNDWYMVEFGEGNLPLPT